MNYKAVIFDMDGTILNTLDDLRVAINYAMGECGHRGNWPNTSVRYLFGSGIDVAVRRALAMENGATEEDLLVIGTEPGADVTPQDMGRYDGSAFGVEPAEVERIKAIYMPYYAEHCNDLTGPYDGIPETIKALRAAGIKTAVVSNKPDGAVQTLANELFPGLFDVSIGELPEIRRKPAPDMTEKAMRILGVAAEESVYVGDTEIDMQTAANVNLPCISVTWGFRSRAFLTEHGASPIIDAAQEILPIVMGAGEGVEI